MAFGVGEQRELIEERILRLYDSATDERERAAYSRALGIVAHMEFCGAECVDHHEEARADR